MDMTLASALETYDNKWRNLIKERRDKQFFRSLKPVAIGWKVDDRSVYNAMLGELHDQADHIIETWMNGRWIAKVHLKTALPNGIKIIKLMQRRPGSADPVGLDHVDFFIPQKRDLAEIFTNEDNLKWSEESNDVIENYHWISLWFNGTEAKLKFDTVLDTIQAELKEMNQKIIAA